VGMYGDIADACGKIIKVAGRFDPDPACREIYDKNYESYKQLFNDLADLFRKSYE